MRQRGAQHALGRERQLGEAAAGRGSDGVGDGGSNAVHADLARALGAEWTVRLLRLDDDGVDLERRVGAGRNLVIHHRGVDQPAAVPDQFLDQREA